MFRKGMKASALALALALASSAQAAPVTYSATGAFRLNNASPYVLPSLGLGNGLTLSYSSQPSITTPTDVDPIGVSSTFGQFTLTLDPSAPPPPSNVGLTLVDAFRLTITQTDPTNGFGNTLGNITGTLTKLQAGNVFVLSFEAINIGDYTYDPGSVNLTVSPSVLSNTETLNGEIFGPAVVPAPAAAVGGFALFAGMGLKRLLRK